MILLYRLPVHYNQNINQLMFKFKTDCGQASINISDVVNGIPLRCFNL